MEVSGQLYALVDLPMVYTEQGAGAPRTLSGTERQSLSCTARSTITIPIMLIDFGEHFYHRRP